MKIQVQAGALATAAAWAAKLAPQRPPTPITAGVLITAEGDQLTLAATDYDLFGTVTVTGALIPDGGRTVVSARLLAELTKTVRRDDETLLETGGRGLEVRCGRSRWVLPEMDAGLWPASPSLGDPLGQVEAAVLARGTSRVLTAVDTEKPEMTALTGVEFTLAERITLAATNCYRLAVIDIPWQPLRTPPDGQATSITVPGELLRLTLAALNDQPQQVTLHTDGNTVAFTTTRHHVTSRLLDGQYPRWRPLIPHDTPTSITVDITDLGLAVTRVTIAGTESTICLDVTEGGIEVSCGDNSDPVEPRGFTGDPIRVGIAPQYLRAALVGVDSPTVTMRFTADPGGSVLLVAADDHGKPLDDGYLHLVKAKRINGGRHEPRL